MKKAILAIFVVMSSLSATAQSVYGLWENRDEDTGKIDSVIKVFKGTDGYTYGNIIELTDKDRQDAVCSECSDDDYRKGKKLIGMQILSKLKKDGDVYEDGEILDPKNGKIYSCYIKLEGNDKLKVKGHIKGFKWIGRSVYWYRKK